MRSVAIGRKKFSLNSCSFHSVFQVSLFHFQHFCAKLFHFPFSTNKFYATFFSQKFTSIKMNIAEKRDSSSDKISTQNFSIFCFRQTSFYASFFSQKFTSTKITIPRNVIPFLIRFQRKTFLYSVFDKQVFQPFFSRVFSSATDH